MKTATLPSIRVEPGLRDQLEQVLLTGESLSAFVEQSVRDEVKRRVDRAAFIARGLASSASARRGGKTISAADVLQGLEDRLQAAQAQQRASATRPRR